MSNKNSNFPSNQLNNLQTGVCRDVVNCLMELADQGKPTSLEELKERINSYFEFCARNDFRPGIEALCLSLSISRQTLWNWCNGINASPEWMEECKKAKQFILTFLEQISLTGKINPASSIFYLKNWGAYVDSISLDSTMTDKETRPVLPASALPRLGNPSTTDEEIM